MRLPGRLIPLAAVCLVLVAAGQARAGEGDSRWTFSPTFNDFGTTGLLQMPTGRMAPDGTFAFGYSYVDPYRRYFVTSQFLPWLQTTFRYTDIGYAPYGIVDTQSYKDKSVDVKFRLVEEGPKFPEVSLGLRDIGGTGIFASEYLVASRRFYDFSFTLGLAWGGMGSRGTLTNPLSYLSNRFKTRPVSTGTGSFGTGFFRGEDIGIFGGVEWDTPIDGLRLKVEYDSNSYQKEFQNVQLDVQSPVNLGISYTPVDGIDLSLGYERGNTVMFRAILFDNFNTDKGLPKVRDVKPLPVDQAVMEAPAPAEGTPAGAAGIGDGETPGTAADRVLSLLATNGLAVNALSIRDGAARISLSGTVDPAPEDLAQAATVVLQDHRAGVSAVAFTSSDGRPLGYFTLGDGQPVGEAAGEGSASGAIRTTEAAAGLPATTPEAVRPRMEKALEYYGFTPLKLEIEGSRLIVVYSQGKFHNLAKAMGRVARAAALATGPDITEVETIETAQGLVIARAVFPRASVISAGRGEITVDELWLKSQHLPKELPRSVAWGLDDVDPDLTFGVTPQLRQNIGGPNNFYLFQVYAALRATLDLAPGLIVSGNIGINLYNNFGNFTYDAPSGLPRVRTDIRQYLTTSDIWIDNLSVNYFTSLGPDWYGRATVGLLELMYGGIDGEVMYRPSDQRWAIGLDVNHVWQRDFNGGFGFRDYDVTTGHLTWYQAMPFYDMVGTLSVGRYLAGDIGATITLGRQFENGITVGVWATKTDVSPHQFGEGSFDKGFYIQIPFDLFSLTSTKTGGTIAFAPLTRDGGAKVGLPYTLWGITSDADRAYTGWRDTLH